MKPLAISNYIAWPIIWAINPQLKHYPKLLTFYKLQQLIFSLNIITILTGIQQLILNVFRISSVTQQLIMDCYLVEEVWFQILYHANWFYLPHHVVDDHAHAAAIRRPTGLLATLANYITNQVSIEKMSLYPYSCIDFDISIYQIARNFERNPMSISVWWFETLKSRERRFSVRRRTLKIASLPWSPI